LVQSFDVNGSCLYESCAFTNFCGSDVRNHLLILSACAVSQRVSGLERSVHACSRLACELRGLRDRH
jgi:ligand-binding sensor protein